MRPFIFARVKFLSRVLTALNLADFVTLHLPATPDRSPVMGAAEFAKMKAGAYFINVARGTLFDEDALVDTLTSGRIRGVGLDVTRQEPPRRPATRC